MVSQRILPELYLYSCTLIHKIGFQPAVAFSVHRYIYCLWFVRWSQEFSLNDKVRSQFFAFFYFFISVKISILGGWYTLTFCYPHPSNKFSCVSVLSQSFGNVTTSQAKQAGTKVQSSRSFNSLTLLTYIFLHTQIFNKHTQLEQEQRHGSSSWSQISDCSFSPCTLSSLHPRIFVLQQHSILISTSYQQNRG